ncbi:sigma-70 family RNA polymerase sigma factor [Gammaproteobacteria bacterium]|nr:sigma-70 family RNA polymerase sigma factor [Gammaproteobacteria bacterium]
MSSKEKDNNPVYDGTGSKKTRYEQLVNAYYNDIFRYAYWLGKSRPLAEDLTQETFLRAWRALDSLQSPGAAKAWLFTILRRENARLYEKYRPETEDIDDYSLADGDKHEPDQKLERALLHKAMDSLDAEYRDPLMLQVIGGFNGDEISNILNLNNNTVMTRLFRARAKLKQVLNK